MIEKSGSEKTLTLNINLQYIKKSLWRFGAHCKLFSSTCQRPGGPPAYMMLQQPIARF